MDANELLSTYAAGRRDFTGVCLLGAELGAVCLPGIILSGANLSGAFLDGADLSGARLVDATFRGARMAGANLTGARCDRCDFAGADLVKAVLTRARFCGASLNRANCTAANLQRADLTSADLRHANLRDADLTEACLADADLLKANLRRATLAGADCTGADFREVQPRNVDFTATRSAQPADAARAQPKVHPGTGAILRREGNVFYFKNQPDPPQVATVSPAASAPASTVPREGEFRRVLLHAINWVARWAVGSAFAGAWTGAIFGARDDVLSSNAYAQFGFVLGAEVGLLIGACSAVVWVPRRLSRDRGWPRRPHEGA